MNTAYRRIIVQVMMMMMCNSSNTLTSKKCFSENSSSPVLHRVTNQETAIKSLFTFPFGVYKSKMTSGPVLVNKPTILYLLCEQKNTANSLALNNNNNNLGYVTF